MEECLYLGACTVKPCEEDSCIRWKEMSTMLELSQLPPNQWTPKKLVPDDVDYDAFCDLNDIKDNIKSFVDKGNNLYLYSTRTGNGKTSWAVKMMLKYFDSVWPGNGFRCRGLFVHVPSFLVALKNFERKDDPQLMRLKTELGDVDLVIWDDIASTVVSNYDYSQLLTYIDKRVFSQKSNIFTGNLKGEGLDKAIGSRLASRIWNSSQTIELKGLDKRGL